MALQIVLAVAVFTGIVVSLSALILAARSKLVETGSVHMLVNGDKDFEVSAGVKLLVALSGTGLYLPAGCGGKGTCGQCRVKVLHGGGALLPTEESMVSRNEASQHVRLACQVSVREDIQVEIPEEVFGVRKWECEVRSTYGLSTFIKEICLELPAGEEVPFRAGGYIQVECPPYQAKFSDFEIEAQYRDTWDEYKLWRFECRLHDRYDPGVLDGQLPRGNRNHTAQHRHRAATPGCRDRTCRPASFRPICSA